MTLGRQLEAATGPCWQQLFAAIDGRDARAFAGFLAPDAEFRFGNAPPVVGRAAIEAAVTRFFGAIAGCRHEVVRTWTSSGAVGCEGWVIYTRHDGRDVTVPFANVFDLSPSGIASYRIYIDNTPLFAP